MTPEQFIFWLSGFLSYYFYDEDECGLSKDDVKKIIDALKTVSNSKFITCVGTT